MADDAVWRRRFFLFMAARIFGALVFLVGGAITFTDLLREGGWPVLGAIVMVLGIADALFAPRLLKKQWEMEDRASDEPS
ncbi:MAG TPA: hypothetical protein VMK31_00920 [Sphingomicrobium sp.]|nr:hypothetical protein [Sphingomicrobium sp.]